MPDQDDEQRIGNPGTKGDAQPARAFTLADLQGPPVRASQWRRIPELTLGALALVRRAAPRQFVATIVLQVASAAALGVQLLVGRHLLNELITVSDTGGAVSSLLPEFGLLIAATVCSYLAGALIAHQQRLLVELVGRHTFDQIIEVATKVELESFERPAFYDQLERARRSGLYRPTEMVTSVTTLTTSVVTSLGVGAALAALEPLLLPLVLAAAVPVFLATVHNSRQAYTFEYAITPQSRERMYLMELLTERETAKEVRVFGSTAFLSRRYDALTEERFRYLRVFLRKRLGVALVGTAGGAIGTTIALGSLAVLLGTDRIDVATTVAAGVAMQVLASRLSNMTGSLGTLVESGMFLDDYNTFLALGGRHRDARGPVADGPRRRAPRGFEGLTVEDVSFTYPDTAAPVLHAVSLEVTPGEVVALVGENGSGKTTLVKLICQLYRPQAGRILWNGVEARQLDPEVIRADMTVLFQDYVQYHLTALDNIALGRAERPPDLHDVEAAARRAGAQGFIERLPRRYDTRLGRQFYGGHELSVGQWQRLALARAFYRGGEFLILDEPTAALDPRAEHELFAQMRHLAAGRSALLISHRFSSVRSADRIYVLRAGRIIESGNHAELVARGGHYAELFRLQAAAYLDEKPER